MVRDKDVTEHPQATIINVRLHLWTLISKTGEVISISAIHPIVICLRPVETQAPQTLTELKFFLLETKEVTLKTGSWTIIKPIYTI